MRTCHLIKTSTCEADSKSIFLGEDSIEFAFTHSLRTCGLYIDYLEHGAKRDLLVVYESIGIGKLIMVYLISTISTVTPIEQNLSINL